MRVIDRLKTIFGAPPVKTAPPSICNDEFIRGDALSFTDRLEAARADGDIEFYGVDAAGDAWYRRRTLKPIEGIPEDAE